MFGVIHLQALPKYSRLFYSSRATLPRERNLLTSELSLWNVSKVVHICAAVHGGTDSGVASGRGDRPERQSGGAAIMGVIRGQQASHDFWGRQNCSPPIAHATPLGIYTRIMREDIDYIRLATISCTLVQLQLQRNFYNTTYKPTANFN